MTFFLMKSVNVQLVTLPSKLRSISTPNTILFSNSSSQFQLKEKYHRLFKTFVMWRGRQLMTLDSFSVLNMQQCFSIFSCWFRTLKTMSNLSRKNYCRKVSKNSLQPISTPRMLLPVFIFHLVKFVPSWQAAYHCLSLKGNWNTETCEMDCTL